MHLVSSSNLHFYCICPLVLSVWNAKVVSLLSIPVFACSWAPPFYHVHHVTTPLISLISSLSLNLYADDTQLFFSFHPPDVHSSITYLHGALQQISSWMTSNLLTLNSSKLNSSSLDSNGNLPNFRISLWIPPIQLATLASFLIKILPSLIRYHHSLGPATLTLLRGQSSAALHSPLPWLLDSQHHRHFYCAFKNSTTVLFVL